VSDLLLRNLTSGAVTLWTMQEARVAARASWPMLTSPWRIAASGDFDGDGFADILWRNSDTGELIAWRDQGGTIVSSGALDVAGVAGIALDRNWKVQGTADFDGDGRDDIVLVNPGRGAVELLLMNGTTVVSHISRTAPTPDWRVIATPDADGDGIAEIVWHNTRTHALSLESLAAPGAPVLLPSEARRWRVLGSGDVNGDGREDLLMQNRRSGLVQAWLLAGSQVTPSGTPLVPPSGTPSLRGLGDFDGDGRADAFWQKASGSIEIWFATAKGTFESGRVSADTGGAIAIGDDGD
jgi:hypothetical protein